MNPGNAWNVAAQFVFSTPYQLKKNFLVCCTSINSNITQQNDIENYHDSSLSLKLSSNLQLLVSQFNNANPENSNETENIFSSKYCDIEKMNNIGIPHKNKLLPLFHINACSLNKIFDDLQHLLTYTKKLT